MRNKEFVPLVTDLIRQEPGIVGVLTFDEAGVTQYPSGFVIKTARSEVKWQAVQQLAPAESHEHPAPEVEGLPAAWDDARTDSGDGWVAAVIGRARRPEIARIVCWSQRPDAGPDEGVTVHFHNGARSFLRRV